METSFMTNEFLFDDKYVFKTSFGFKLVNQFEKISVNFKWDLQFLQIFEALLLNNSRMCVNLVYKKEIAMIKSKTD